MASVKNRLTNDIKQVKNLGWLLDHAGEVRYINVTDIDGESVMLEAVLNEHIFCSEFADVNVCREWLKKRRAMRGVPVNFLSEKFTI